VSARPSEPKDQPSVFLEWIRSLKGGENILFNLPDAISLEIGRKSEEETPLFQNNL